MPKGSAIPDLLATNDDQHPDTHGSLEQIETTFEWNERQTTPDGDARHTADGMASLTVGNRRRGYLGNSSGSSLLERISSTLPGRMPSEWEISPHHAPSPAFNMQRLTMARGMSSSTVRESLIEAYFRHYNTSYPIIHQDTFRKACNKRTSISPSSTWHIIYFMVLAIGEWVNNFSDDTLSLYYDAARSRLNMNILEAGTISTVQALLLLSNYLQKTDRPNTAYNFLGIAYRVALGLGLHRETTKEQTPETCALQQRRLIFWTLYSFDSGFSLTTGRPIMVADQFIDTKKPLNIDDSGCKPTSPLPSEVSYPTISAAMVAQSHLAVIANRIHSTFQSVNGIPDLEHATLIMSQALKDWKEALPWYFTGSEVPDWFLGPRAMVLWKASNIHLVLLIASQKSFADPHSRRKYSKKSCQVAMESINEVCDFCELHKSLLHHGFTWYVVYYLLQCLLAIEAQRTHVEKDPGPLRKVQVLPNALPETVARAHNCLLELSQNNKPAARVCQLLDHLSKRRCSGQQDVVDSSNGSLNASQATENNLLFDSAQQTSVSELGNYLPDSSMTMSNDSPQSPFGSNITGRTWMMAADPSLHMFMDGSNDLGDIFDDLGGFPSANDGDNFSYYLGGHQF
ncbi:uncharacterized protein N0V89_003653 [Didymosphaeria variabile]|uniref:Xylanolytic transcriptional activator regulatory domain-containing protein n=1 Tax=Didymosphaeria variabile TaxID=1932322 RepID=A0A9W8XN15_9PLEO|nr:uncharacterized protein N0V89_003653 [Didymosphaeria variabile]KAJ4355633.1 hypothetical protein N0V89_003653 [Didymosphaeria variabile]